MLAVVRASRALVLRTSASCASLRPLLRAQPRAGYRPYTPRSEEWLRESNERALRRIEPILGKRGFFGVQTEADKERERRRAAGLAIESTALPENLTPLMSPVLGTRAVRFKETKTMTNVESPDVPLYEKLHVRVMSYDYRLLDSFMYFIKRLAEELQIPNSGIAFLPTTYYRLTVNRSPFANKKARDQYEKPQHVRAIKFYNMTQRTADVFVAALEDAAPPACGLSINEYSYEQVPESMRKTDPNAAGWVDFADVDKYFEEHPTAKAMATMSKAKRPHVRESTDYIAPLRPKIPAFMGEGWTWPEPFDPTKGPFIDAEDDIEQIAAIEAQNAQEEESGEVDEAFESRLKAMLDTSAGEQKAIDEAEAKEVQPQPSQRLVRFGRRPQSSAPPSKQPPPPKQPPKMED